MTTDPTLEFFTDAAIAATEAWMQRRPDLDLPDSKLVDPGASEKMDSSFLLLEELIDKTDHDAVWALVVSRHDLQVYKTSEGVNSPREAAVEVVKEHCHAAVDEWFKRRYAERTQA